MSLASRLNRLFEVAHGQTTARHANAEVARALETEHGVSVTPEYLRMLRSGAKESPRPELIQALAKHFGVPAGYLLGDNVEAVEAELGLLQALREAGVKEIALRSMDLSPESVSAIADVVTHLRRLEGLEAGNDEPP